MSNVASGEQYPSTYAQYQELDFKARRAIFKMFLERVAAIVPLSLTTTPKPPSASALEPTSVVAFSDAELDRLARRGPLNGRQIKNAVRSAHALALNEKKQLVMPHMLEVLEAAEAFEQDLKGGAGYMDAMRSYT